MRGGRRASVVGVAWAALGLLAACSSSSADPSEPQSPPTAPSTAPSTVPSTTAKPTTTAAPQPVTIAFAGDINFEGPMATRLARDPATAIGPFAPILSGADVAVGNLESAIATGGTPENKEFT